MRIIHFCLSCFYIDNYSYQENELVSEHVLDGHDVLVVASTETYGSDRRITYVDPCTYLGSDGAKVVRVPYSRWLPVYVMRKLRVYSGVYSLLVNFKPDLIVFHGLCGWGLVTVSRYVKKNKGVKFYIDSHTDHNNSARGFFSKYFLHFSYYAPLARHASKAARKVLCVSQDVLEFARHFYKISEEKLEFYPLGGKLIDKTVYEETRRRVRDELGLNDDDRVFVQTGKIDKLKMLLESLDSFAHIEDPGCKFFIVGSLQDDIKDLALPRIESDPRIRFLGWRSPEELREILCAADVYVQPGSQSATMQMSICCNCVVILADVISHVPYVKGNGWLVDNNNQLREAFGVASSVPRAELLEMMSKSGSVASEMLDYKKLAARLYQ